jgi:dCTP deaminase
MNSFQQFSLSYADALIAKISDLYIRNIPSYLKEACRKILISIKNDINNIVDSQDLIVFRSRIDYVFAVIDIFSKTNSDISSWVFSLIEECYGRLGLDFTNRKILIIQSSDSQYNSKYSSYSVTPDILSHFKEVLDEYIPIDIFVIPSEAMYDIASISLIAHEVGHVYLNNNIDKLDRFIQVEIDGYNIRNKSDNLFTAGKLQNHKEILTSHVEEYICDFFGRILLGIGYDFALLKLFCNSEFGSDDISETHPPICNRIHYSRLSLNNFTSVNSELTECVNKMRKVFSEVTKKDYPYVVLAEDIAEKFIKGIEINEVFNEPYLQKSWRMVIPELNSFRPPFETVSIGDPILLTPSQNLVCSTIYFYGEQYLKTNDFFLQSKIEPNEKYEILRKRLIEHIRYAISKYSFLKKTKLKINFSECKSELDSTLWSLREKKLEGKTIPHVVIVPTIDPKTQYNSNSIDLRLGSVFLISNLSKYTHISPESQNENIPIETYYTEHFVEIGDDFTLHPHQFILAQTLEYVCIPSEYYALVLGRSSWGRLGLNIATATAVGSGFRGCITLELRNLGETPLKLKVGARICQICLIPIPISNSPAGYYANSSKYIGPVTPEIPKIRNDRDWDLLA